MSREDFLEVLREQFAEEIHEAYIECEHDGGAIIDMPALNKKLVRMVKAAKVQGFPESDFRELVRSTLPDLADQIEILAERRKAA